MPSAVFKSGATWMQIDHRPSLAIEREEMDVHLRFISVNNSERKLSPSRRDPILLKGDKVVEDGAALLHQSWIGARVGARDRKREHA
ncbi:hypothetical protein DW2_17747 [Thioclava atlantica]|uniref:Uncharacterized protein n=1 Tax=Thioclava atlantica TaxID=1317124 RepID=A0A085TS47_9RHOB|nr:hypothetical protein DW2_17747 [Thioclava atlantica]